MFRRAAVFGLLTLWAAASPARAELGSVRTEDELRLPEEPRLLVPAAPSASAINADSLVVDAPEALDHSWHYELPSGPTAYLLEAREVELAIPLSRFSELLSDVGLPQPVAAIRYGVLSAVTLEVQAGLASVEGGAKLRLTAPGDNQLALRPWVGFRYLGCSDAAAGLAAIAGDLTYSHVFSPRHRLHLSLEAAYFSGQQAYPVWYGTSSDGSAVYAPPPGLVGNVGRISVAYELRLGTGHGLTFWAAPALEISNSSEATSALIYSAWNLTRTELLLELGVGYQYDYKQFGASIGLNFGPSYSVYSVPPEFNGGYSDSDSNSSFSGAISGGLSYRI